ncbi:MAG TPA: ribosome silencing factor [Polyangiaceae bacterium]|nr:ribosome silencing factor [Polyangiaceae bacterium]
MARDKSFKGGRSGNRAPARQDGGSRTRDGSRAGGSRAGSRSGGEAFRSSGLKLGELKTSPVRLARGPKKRTDDDSPRRFDKPRPGKTDPKKSPIGKARTGTRQSKPARHTGTLRGNWPKPQRAEPRSERSRTTGRAVARPSSGNDASRKTALLAAQAGLEKKATQIEIIDVTGKVDYADFLVLMTGQSDRNVAAIADEVESFLAKNGMRAMAVEGLPEANWVLIDFVDVVVHVFQQDSRLLYDLDGLWMDARRVPVQGAAQNASVS